MIHPWTRLALGLRGVDRQLQETAPAHDIGELAELGCRFRGFAFELGLR
jgi:hypothetical protein